MRICTLNDGWPLLCGEGRTLASQSCLGQVVAQGANCLHLNALNQPLFIKQFSANTKVSFNRRVFK